MANLPTMNAIVVLERYVLCIYKMTYFDTHFYDINVMCCIVPDRLFNPLDGTFRNCRRQNIYI